MKYVETGENYYHSVGYAYDAKNNLTALVETINGTDYVTSYVYDDDNRLTSMTTNGTTVEYTYDDYGRVCTQVTKRGDTTILTETFTYVDPSNSTTSSQIALYSVISANYSNVYDYVYDDNGNIVQITDNHGDIEHQYDSANQLIREDNDILEYTHVWAYDNAGNIQTRTEYSYFPSSLVNETPTDTVMYLYGDSDWGDLLTTYDGQAITYDTIGNPLSDSTRTYTWKHGRELSSLTQNNVTWNYTYNSDGLRTSRTNGTKTYNYIYSGSQLVQMSVDGCTYDFTYDASGTPLTVSFNGGTYYYVTNVQGDVVSILNSAGEPVVQYFYDAWGNILITGGTLASSLGGTNPLRYRGYVYDQETELYYLQSRYYDPALGRFINADGLVSTGQGLLSNNMFAYCLNNPANGCDPCGTCFHHLKIWKDCDECAAAKARQEEQKEERKKSVTYTPRKNGRGAIIGNAHNITNIFEMYDFISENRGDEIGGATAGIIVEWVSHNIAYSRAEKAGNQDAMNRIGTVDVGYSIFDDNHGWYTLGMIAVYAHVAPLSYTYDYFLYGMEHHVL